MTEPAAPAASPFRVGIKYCGGCNPRYDRPDFVRRLAEACPGASFVPARPGGQERLLVVCGCTARCADLTGLDAPLGRLTVCSAQDFPLARAFCERKD